MKRLASVPGVLLCPLLLPRAVTAQAPVRIEPPRVVSSVDRTAMWIADRVTFTGGLREGAVRERLAAYKRMRERARHAFSRFTAMLPENKEGIRLLGTSGTVTTLASVHLALPSYDRRAVDGLHVPIEAMQKISGMIATMDYEERSSLPCIGTERADLVVAGCAILEAILDIWPANRLGVADRGIREGILRGMMAADADGFAAQAALRRLKAGE